MLSLTRMQQLVDSGREQHLLREIVRNGLSLPLPLQVHLASSRVAPLALALRRLAELTYGPTDLATTLTRRLLDLQSDDGSFRDDTGRPDPVLTACAASALVRVAGMPDMSGPGLRNVCHRSLGALVELQGTGDRPVFRSGWDHTDRDLTQTNALILFLLGDHPPFREAVRLAELTSWLEEHEDAMDPATQQLWQIAQLSRDPLYRTPTAPTPVPRPARTPAPAFAAAA